MIIVAVLGGISIGSLRKYITTVAEYSLPILDGTIADNLVANGVLLGGHFTQNL